MSGLGAPDVRRVLARAKIVRIATLSRKGVPHLTPLWFVCGQGKVYMGTRADSPAGRDIAAHPAVTLLFEEPGGPRVLRVRGRAVFDREGLIRREALRFGPKYLLSPGALRDQLSNLGMIGVRRRYYSERGDEGGFIVVTMESAEFLPKPA